MQTSPKTPKKIFATRLLGVILCLVISLSVVIIPARGFGHADPISDEFDIIASALAADGIASNIGDVTFVNVTAFPSLYFEKWATVGDSTTKIGRMTFINPINFSDEETVAFLLTLKDQMQMDEGSIALDVSTAAGFQGKPATLVMYGLPLGIKFAELVVSDELGSILVIADFVDESTFSQHPVTGDVTFIVAHFTKFEIDLTPYYIYTYLPLIIR